MKVRVRLLCFALGVLPIGLAGAAVWWYTFPSAWLLRAKGAVRKQNWSSAYNLLERVIAADPDNVTAQFLLAQSAASLGRFERSLNALQHVPEDDPHHGAAGSLTAQVLMRLDRAADAERLLTRILRQRPDAFAERALLLEIFRWEDRTEEAREQLEQIAASVRSEDLGFAIWLEINRFLLDYGGYGTTAREEKLRRFLQQDPHDFHARLALGRLYLKKRDVEAGFPILDQAYRERPDDVHAQFALLEYHLDFAPTDPADTAFAAQLLEGLPAAYQGAKYWGLKGQYLEQQEELTEAKRAYEQALDLRPDDRKSLYQLAQVLIRLGDAEQARDLLRQFQELSSLTAETDVAALVLAVARWADQPRAPQRTDIPLLCQLGNFYQKLGRTSEADHWLELAKRAAIHYQHLMTDKDRRAGRAIVVGTNAAHSVFRYSITAMRSSSVSSSPKVWPLLRRPG